MRERFSSALLSEPATTHDLINTLTARNYNILHCQRIDSCLEKKWIARIAHQSRPDQILENENIWLYGFEVSFITGEDEAQFLPKSPCSQDDKEEQEVDQWSDASVTLDSYIGSWHTPHKQTLSHPAAGLELVKVVCLLDIEPEKALDIVLNVRETIEEEEKESIETPEDDEKAGTREWPQDEDKVRESVDEDEEDGSATSVDSPEQDLYLKKVNTELREQVEELEKTVNQLGLLVREKYKTKEAFVAAGKAVEKEVKMKKILLEKNEKLRADNSDLRETNKQLREEINALSEENERLKEENSKMQVKLCCSDMN